MHDRDLEREIWTRLADQGGQTKMRAEFKTRVPTK